MNRTSTIERNAQTSLHLRKGLRVMKIASHERTLRDFNKSLILLTALTAFSALIACDGGDEVDGNTVKGSAIGSQSVSSNYVSEVRYPTNAEDFQDSNLLYGNRDFLSEYNGIKHLGRDLIYPIGEMIHPIAGGKIVFYDKADSYGTLVVVIEHTLETPITVTNGDGQSVSITKFLSIYGHGSKTDPKGIGPNLPWRVGEAVTTDDVISYIQTNALNGAGPEHLHLGIRVQSKVDAQNTEPRYWIRGNDELDGSFKKYYTRPKTFLPALANHLGVSLESSVVAGNITHHPIGTLLFDEETGKDWLVVEDDQILNVTNYKTLPRACRITTTREELSCYRETSFHETSTVLDATVIKFDGSSEVYRLYPGGGFEATGYQVFLSYESFLSWGYTDSDIQHFPSTEKQELVSALKNEGGIGFMPGALAKGFGDSEVTVANQHGTRRPIFSWELFQSLGYNSNCVYEIEPSTLDVVAGARSSDLITESSTLECPTGTSKSICSPGSVLPCSCGTTSGTQSCLDDGKSFGPCMCEPGPGGGGTGEYCNPPGATLPCDNICAGGVQECLADNTFSACICPAAGTGGASGSSGTGGAGGSPQPECVSGQMEDCTSKCPSGYYGIQPCVDDSWSTCACHPESTGTGGTSGTGGSGGTGGTAGSGGTSGTGGTAGTSGSGGTAQGPDYVSIKLRYQGPTWTMPKFTYVVGSNDWGSAPGCLATTSQTAECNFSLPVASLNSFRWQVSLGNNRYWGDTSGLAPAPCIPASELPNYYGTSVTVIGTVWLELDGVPTDFGLCSNGIINNNYSNICGESQFPWMNACLYP